MSELYCVHIIGPDDIYAAPSKAAAEAAAQKHNEFFAAYYAKRFSGMSDEFKQFFPRMTASVIEYDGTSEDHATAVEKYWTRFAGEEATR